MPRPGRSTRSAPTTRIFRSASQPRYDLGERRRRRRAAGGAPPRPWACRWRGDRGGRTRRGSPARACATPLEGGGGDRSALRRPRCLARRAARLRAWRGRGPRAPARACCPGGARDPRSACRPRSPPRPSGGSPASSVPASAVSAGVSRAPRRRGHSGSSTSPPPSVSRRRRAPDHEPVVARGGDRRGQSDLDQRLAAGSERAGLERSHATHAPRSRRDGSGCRASRG